MNHSATNPVIVLSPSVRAGTTLVQRLLCSAPNTLIYGDVVGQEMEFFAKYSLVKEQMLGFQESTISPVRAAVLAGDTDDFITSLTPTLPCYLGGLKEAALTWLRGCADEAASAGRSVWGWKLAGADAATLPRLAAWFPNARWVWVERDVIDCFRSAKAAKMVQGPADAVNFARVAGASRAAFAPLLSRALVLDFQTMTQDPAGTLRRLEEHTGASGISERVFSLRINQWGVSTPISPADLSPEELAALGSVNESQNPITQAA